MGLRANTEETVATTPTETKVVETATPVVESLLEPKAEVKVKVEAPVEKPVETPQAPATAPAVRQETAPAVVDPSSLSILDLENHQDPEEVGNVFPRIKASSGSINGDGIKYGEYVDMQVLTWHKRWFIVPGVQDEAAQKLCRASYDGKTIVDRESGDRMSIEDYLKDLHDNGYPKAKVSDYYDVIGVIFNAHKEAEKAFAKGVVQLSVSPTSKQSYTAFIRQIKIMVMRGMIRPTHQTCVRVLAKEVNSKKGDYTKTEFAAVPLDVADAFTPVPY